MFLVFGVRTIRRDVKGSALERERCARCGFFSDFRQQREKRYFTLFSPPVFPLPEADPVLTCNRCGTSYHTNHYQGQPGAGMDAGLE
jgi:ribosomal protein L37E